jgi:hypothetical protein
MSRFLQDVEQRFSAVDSIPLGIGNLLHDSILFEAFNCALGGGESQVQLIRSAGDGDKWICVLCDGEDASGYFFIDRQTFRTFLLVLYGTGARFGETLALRYEDVNQKAGFLTFRAERYLFMAPERFRKQLNRLSPARDRLSPARGKSRWRDDQTLMSFLTRPSAQIRFKYPLKRPS